MSDNQAGAALTAAADEMERYILTRGGVSMVELEQQAAKHINVRGGLAWVTKGDSKLCMWFSMSQEFVDALEIMRARKRVEPTPTTPLVYVMDGKVPSVPIAKRPPKDGYKADRWVPVVFNASARAEAGGR